MKGSGLGLGLGSGFGLGVRVRNILDRNKRGKKFAGRQGEQRVTMKDRVLDAWAISKCSILGKGQLCAHLHPF